LDDVVQDALLYTIPHLYLEMAQFVVDRLSNRIQDRDAVEEFRGQFVLSCVSH
jgi:hypothetical protein